MSSPGQSKPIYVIDTSALMDWHDRFYPTDVFPALVELADGLISSGRLLSVQIAFDEVGSIGSAGLQSWAKSRRTLFDSTANHLAEALAIEGAYPALKDPRALFPEADAYIIALAQLRGGVVVTAETPASQKRRPRGAIFIPDVCAALGLTCINNLGMMRREGWKL